MRYISDIASDIESFCFVDLNKDASDALCGMHCIESLEDFYEGQSGMQIVTRFLSNAKNWNGNQARRIKNELKNMIGGK